MQIHGETIRFGVHAAPQNATFGELSAMWRRCEQLGFDWVSVFDHFMPIYSDPAGPCFEGTTAMAALAAQTSQVRCGMLVSGVTYRHPAISANIAATIDHISGGRAEYGVGAAWYELEHDQYGVPFPRIGTRMDILDETCHIMRGLWTHETFSFEGKHFQLKDARLEPKPVQEHLPLVIGGGGEKRTLRIVAEHADIWNGFLGEVDAYRHKLDVLRGHCGDAGRYFGAIRKSLTLRAFLAESEADAEAKRRGAVGDAPPNPIVQLITGTPEQCVEALRPFAELGVGDFLLGAMAPFDHETVELFGEQVAPALRAS